MSTTSFHAFVTEVKKLRDRRFPTRCRFWLFWYVSWVTTADRHKSPRRVLLYLKKGRTGVRMVKLPGGRGFTGEDE
jgi:hypothetical protein